MVYFLKIQLDVERKKLLLLTFHAILWNAAQTLKMFMQ